MHEEERSQVGFGEETIEHDSARERCEEDSTHFRGSTQHEAVEARAEQRLHPVAPRSAHFLVGGWEEATERRIRRRLRHAEERVELLDQV